MRVRYIQARKIRPGDVIAHPPSGSKYTVTKVVHHEDTGVTEITYKPERGTLGVRVKSARPIACWRKDD